VEGLSTAFWWLIAVICICIGLIGTVLPALPGTPLIFVGMLIAAWINDFQLIGAAPLAFAGILSLLAIAADFVSTALGAKRVGASKLAIVGAALGTLTGLFFLPFGLLIGPFVGAVVGEYYQRRDFKQAGKVGLGTWLGLLVGSAAKIALAFMMIAILVSALVI
jgi:uncharacterized protein YqgC (DUF456 family)